ncbi:hypothetical protein CYG49_02770 [Candidatus Saccharibacteria bacterium]|nr:MAG: hypothetical protein CYG49_02770 [Candidatus Saccharibacteria bacterium]
MRKEFARQEGAVTGLLIANVLLTVFVLIFGSVMIWALISYNDQKNNVDAKINAAVAQAKKEQADEDEKQFIEREKEPTRPFLGPEDLGRVSFNYPKTWSVYINKTGSEYEAFLHPGVVMPLTSKQPYALKVNINNNSYERELQKYEQQVKKGDLKSSPTTVNGYQGNRLDGKFTNEVTGSMVIFKIRDKALTLQTQSPTYRNDFDGIVLPKLTFNP